MTLEKSNRYNMKTKDKKQEDYSFKENESSLIKDEKASMLSELKERIAKLEDLNQKLISELKDQQEIYEKTRRNEEKFRNLTVMLPEMIFETDSEGNLVFINKKGINLLGYTKKKLIGEKNISQLITKPGRKKFDPSIKEFLTKELSSSQEYYLIRKDRAMIPVEIHGSPIKNDSGELVGFRGIVLDIAQRKEYEDRIKYLSFHDKLTDLYNRAYFDEELKRLDNKRNLPISVIVGDVNNLKIINDTFGHQHGDQLLSKIAAVLKSCFRRSDVVSRWGGDEFSVILPRTTKERGVAIIQRITQECQKKSTLTLPLSISLGIATKTKLSENINSAVQEAESKMYRYKLADKQTSDNTIINSLEKALVLKKYETREYRENFVACATKFGEMLGMEKKELDNLKLLAMICDIGKIAVSESIILKKGWLSENEWEEIKKHPEIGFRIAKSSPELSNIADAILYHHEFWDGNGYPQKVKGEDIPLLSRIIHIVNAYEAMIHDKPYRKAMSKEDAIKELKLGQGKQFDPELTEKFIDMVTHNKN
ncbi:MAG: diguanylate cyclase [Candidatus Atribacteria bacterium]|nr:diguanylate cyclase [Candidatus Atribacteria bacterium]